MTRRRSLLAALAAALVCASSASASTGYRYFGLRVGGRSALVALDSATAIDGHAAAWMGANSPDRASWVQGGIDWGPWQSARAYIEVRVDGSRPVFRSWPASLRQPIRVVLRHSHGFWRVIVADHWSQRVLIRHATVVSVVELYENAKAVATINGRRIVAG